MFGMLSNVYSSLSTVTNSINAASALSAMQTGYSYMGFLSPSAISVIDQHHRFLSNTLLVLKNILQSL